MSERKIAKARERIKPINPALTAARDYLTRGWKPIPVQAKGKRPLGNDWQNQSVNPENVADVFADAKLNIGVQLGEASHGLTDIDLDCAEAVALADALLPPTGAVFGRKSKPKSHYLFVTNLSATTNKAALQFKDPLAESDKAMLVELRIGGGGRGAQSVVPPSMHESGETVEWFANGDPTQIDGEQLKRYVAAIASGALLARHYPAQGARHDAALVLGGFLARCGFDAGELELFVSAVAGIAGDDEGQERGKSAAGAVALQDAGGEIAGLPRLTEVWGEDIAKAVAKWLGYDSAGDAKTLTQDERIDKQIADLAALPPLDYETRRTEAAKELGVRRSKLDEAVESKRASLNVEKPTPPPNLYELSISAEELIACPDVLARFAEDFGKLIAGEMNTGQLLYLIGTSRLFEKAMHAAIKGPSAAGKSEIRKAVLKFFPPESIISFTALSERALLYLTEGFEHKILSMGEAMSGDEVKFQDYLLRELMSEGVLLYPVVQKINDKMQTVMIEKHGPVAFMVTTTKNKLHHENETRMLSIEIDDGPKQTGRVMQRVATIEGKGSRDEQINLDLWRDFQRWLAAGECRVVVPFANALARLMPDTAVRFRRDIGQIIRAVKAHALVHRQHRSQKPSGEIIATIEDYQAIRGLMASSIAVSAEMKVRSAVRDTLAALEKIQHGGEGYTSRDVADAMNLDASTAWRRLRQAEDAGFVENVEERRGRPGRYRLTDRVDDDGIDVMPSAAELAAEIKKRRNSASRR